MIDPEWFKGLSLAERREGAPRDANLAALDAWRSQKPFPEHSELWNTRLAEDSLTNEELAGLLGESAEALAARAPMPTWLEDVLASFASRAPIDPALTTAVAAIPNRHHIGCMRLVLPFVAHLLPTLRAAVPNEHVLASLLAHVPLLVNTPLTRTTALEIQVARAMKLLTGETPEERFDCFLDAITDADVLPSFWSRHPVLAREVMIKLRGYVAACVELFGHLTTLNPAPNEELVAVSAGVSETHRGGRIVMTLRFASGLRLVYKPRPADVDRAYADALAWIAARAPELPIPRTPRVVSHAEASFHEFIEPRSCANETELARFYERQGVHLALLYVLLARDMHAENLIVAGEHPVLIDLEALMQRPLGARADTDPATAAAEDSVLTTLFLPMKLASSAEAPGVDVSALGARAGQRSPIKGFVLTQLGTDDVRAVYDREDVGTLGVRPGIDGVDADPTKFVDEVVSGFRAAWNAIASDRAAFVDGPLAAFRDASVRVLARSTDYYTAIIERSHHPQNLDDGLARERVFDLLYRNIPEAPHLAPLVPSERADLHRGDVPFFSMRPSSRDLVDARGHVIANFFDAAPFDRARRRILELSSTELERQTWIVRASFASITTGEGEAQWRPSKMDLPPADISSDELVARARRIGDRLADLAIEDGERVGWLGLDLVHARDWVIVSAGNDLYGGSPGVALFLAHLAKRTGERRYADLARRAVHTFLPGLEKQIHAGAPIPIGLSSVGGAIYSLAHLGALEKDADLLETAVRLTRSLSAHVASDRQLDVLEGAAGCLLAMLALHAARPDEGVLDVARACGARLVEAAARSSDGASWTTSLFPKPLSGFGHGASGIAVALIRLAKVTNDESLISLARDAFAFERSSFIDDRWGETRLTAWCHGASGIGLARDVALRELGPDAALAEDLAHALRLTTTHGFGHNHSLCHGDFGNLELLARRDPDGLRKRASRVCASLDVEGMISGVPRGIETPGLFIGCAGIGLQLLRFSESMTHQTVPNILTVDPPSPFG